MAEQARMSDFICTVCGQKHSTRSYNSKSGFPHHECLRYSNLQIHPYFFLSGKILCHNEKQSLSCYLCKNIIKEDRVITKFGVFHRDCFRCSSCRTLFVPSSKIYVTSGKFYCHVCCFSFENAKSCRKTKDISESDSTDVSPYVSESPEETDNPIPKHFNKELRARLSAQFKAMEPHVITDSRSENGTPLTAGRESERRNFVVTSLKAPEIKKREGEQGGAETKTSVEKLRTNWSVASPFSPPQQRPPKPKRVTSYLPEFKQKTRLAADLPPRRISTTLLPSRIPRHGANPSVSNSSGSASLCSIPNKSPAQGDRRGTLPLNASLPLPPTPTSATKSQTELRDSSPLRRRLNVNALITAYERMSQGGEHQKSGITPERVSSQEAGVISAKAEEGWRTDGYPRPPPAETSPQPKLQQSTPGSTSLQLNTARDQAKFKRKDSSGIRLTITVCLLMLAAMYFKLINDSTGTGDQINPQSPGAHIIDGDSWRL